MIDLSEAPEGATGYYVNGASISFYNGDKYWHDFHGKWIDSLNGYEWRSENVVPIKPEWTIYNNTKPLRELTDEQRGLLFNHWCSGGEVEIYSADDGWKPWIHIACVSEKYRAKKKSECELFKDAISKALGHTDLPIAKIAVELFEAGFKAPEDKKC